MARAADARVGAKLRYEIRNFNPAIVLMIEAEVGSRAGIPIAIHSNNDGRESYLESVPGTRRIAEIWPRR